MDPSEILYHPDFVTQMGFWPFWPWKWPWRSIMTLNFLNSWEHPDFELCENVRILDVLTKLGFWPFWPWTWPWRSMMTLILKFLALVLYVSLFSVICIVVMGSFLNLQRRLNLQILDLAMHWSATGKKGHPYDLVQTESRRMREWREGFFSTVMNDSPEILFPLVAHFSKADTKTILIVCFLVPG